MTSIIRSLLLGTAAGLVAMTSAFATALPDKAKPAEIVKVNRYIPMIGAALPIKGDNSLTASTEYFIGTRATAIPGGGTGGSKVADGAGFGIDSLAQKLTSSASYRGTPAHGFHHVLGKIPAFATKMLA